jgi:ribosomal protein S18 acetylase RimI-like enzyme
MSISISEIKGASVELEEFKKKEWHLADLEHYGGPRPYTKSFHKFIATDDEGKIIGMLELEIEANVAYIDGILVASDQKGKGIGKELMLFCEKFAKEKKCTKVWLDTEEGWGAVKFYEKLGYQLTGTHKGHHLGKDGLIYTKFI